MKRITTKFVSVLAFALGVSLCAQAQSLQYLTPSSPTMVLGSNPGFTSINSTEWIYVSPSPNGDANDSLQANYPTAGWNQNAQINFGGEPSQNGNYNANVDIENMLEASGGVNVSFNLIIDNLTYPYTYPIDGGNWAAFQLTGNSLSGGGGYINAGSGAYPSGGVWSPANDLSVTTYAMSFTGTQLGWSADPNNWFQLIFIGNSSGTDGLAFYIDDLTITPVPEPTSLALAGLGAAALLIFRRRK
jgi:hypothetical protein